MTPQPLASALDVLWTLAVTVVGGALGGCIGIVLPCLLFREPIPFPRLSRRAAGKEPQSEGYDP